MRTVKLAFWVFLLMMLGSSVSLAQKDLSGARFQRDLLEEETRKKAEDQIATLFDQYSGALERKLEDFQKRGDLKNALKVREEVRSARELRKTTNEEFPGNERLRETLERKLAEIREEEIKGYAEVDRVYFRSLEDLKLSLTKEGKLDEAQKAVVLMEKVESKPSLPPPAMEPPDPDTYRKAIELSDQVVADTILQDQKVYTGPHTLKPGIHRNFGRVEFGDHSIEDDDAKRGHLTVPPGSTLESGTIYMNIGELRLDQVLAKNMEFWNNLHGDFYADNSLFDQCVFKKAGGWFSGVSSRWRFANCVVSGSFFPKWDKKLVGIQAHNVTFQNVVFPSFAYKEDAGKEAIDQWSVYYRCLFRNCVVSESVIIETTECLFENCTFLKDDEILAQTPIDVVFYYKGSRPEIPEDREKVRYFAKREYELKTKDIGSRLFYLPESADLNAASRTE